MAEAPTTAPLDADDPRISEWIDGRLAPSEAAEVERAVAASPELTRLVDDLRTIRGAMRSAATCGPKTEVSGVLEKAQASGVLKPDLGSRIMATIAASHGGEARGILPSPIAAPARSGRRELPWLGLLGALAAGLLVTVVINLPDDNGRDVALAPEAKKSIENADHQYQDDGRRTAREQAPPGARDLAKKRDEGFVTGDKENAQLPGEAPPIDSLAANAAPAMAAGKARADLEEAPSHESASRFANDEARQAGGFGGRSPQLSAAPPSPPPATMPVPPATPSPAVESGERNRGQNEGEAVSRQAAKSKNVDLAGVLVIAVTNPSERRVLEQLVAESRLEATPDKDHLALMGKAADVDAFLQELARVGLISTVPPRRAAQARREKHTSVESKDARTTTLILRVVERQGKQTEPAQPGEARAKP